MNNAMFMAEAIRKQIEYTDIFCKIHTGTYQYVAMSTYNKIKNLEFTVLRIDKTGSVIGEIPITAVTSKEISYPNKQDVNGKPIHIPNSVKSAIIEYAKELSVYNVITLEG